MVQKGKKSMKRFETLKKELSFYGTEAIEDFLGFEIPEGWDKDTIEAAMDEVWEQMPEEELNKFYEKYDLPVSFNERADIELYDIEHEGIKYVGVNWNTQTFYFKVCGNDVVYKQPHYIDAPEGPARIRMVIEMYLNEIAQKVISEKPGQSKRDAESIMRIFPYADKYTFVKREADNSLTIGVKGCWTAKVDSVLFPTLEIGETKQLGDFLPVKYFSINRPIDPGAFPVKAGNKVLDIVNFPEGRRFCKEIGGEAWGYIACKSKLPSDIADNLREGK